MSNINLIWAQSKNGVIGKDNKLVYRLWEDLVRFKEFTMGKVIVMGRKTWESLPDAVKPLPGRYNVILTRDADYAYDHPNVEVIHNLTAFLRQHDAKEIWIIGGGEIYQQCIDLATTVHVTEVDDIIQGDTYAPKLNLDQFQLTMLSMIRFDVATGKKFVFKTYHRHKRANIHFKKAS
jgi:dihydrofolate reductase